MTGVDERDQRSATAPTAATPTWRAGWPERLWLARSLATLLIAIRLGIVIALTGAFAGALLHPHDSLQLVASWVVLSLLAMALLELTDRAHRRFLPLVALLRLGVAFPDAGPSRFRTALRAGSTRSLRATQHRLAAATEAPPEQAAEALLELVGALGAHDGATRGHCERVRAYTELLAEELGIPCAQRHQLRWGGLVHDVGKLRVPRDVLNKRSALRLDEWELIKRHPMDGLELAAPLRPWLGEAILAVSDHHERWDGGGYPSGVAGTDISLSGRIVCVADAFDVMTSARSYKQPVTPLAAREELVACAGGQFDPDVVRAFLAIPMRRLRPILGPLVLVQAAVQVQWRLTRYPAPRRAVAGALITAVTYVGGAFGITDGTPRPVGTPTATAPAANTPLTPPRHVLPPAPKPTLHGKTEAAASPTGHLPGRAALPRPAAPPGTAGRQPSLPPRTSASPGPSVGSGGGIVIDPSTGEVSVIPPHTVPAEVPPLVRVPLVGQVACGGLNACSPIVIPLPPLPLL